MANDFKVDDRQLKRLEQSLARAGKDLVGGKRKLLKKIGVIVQGLAKKYCPESPVKSDYKRRGLTPPDNITSGQLRKSIQSETGDNYVSINVPSNTAAGKYAEKIHDEKGKAWFKRGVRTKEKGPKADEKFIFRAADDSEKEIDGLVDAVIREFINEI